MSRSSFARNRTLRKTAVPFAATVLQVTDPRSNNISQAPNMNARMGPAVDRAVEHLPFELSAGMRLRVLCIVNVVTVNAIAQLRRSTH